MVFRGEKCLLRSVCAEDADVLLAWENDPRIWQYGSERRQYSREEVDTFIREQRYDIALTGQQRFMIVSCEGGGIAGAIDLYDYNAMSAGVGVLIYNENDRRKGYATEALRLLVHHARSLRMTTLYADIDDSNCGSRRLFEKCGFTIAGGDFGKNVTRFALNL